MCAEHDQARKPDVRRGAVRGAAYGAAAPAACLCAWLHVEGTGARESCCNLVECHCAFRTACCLATARPPPASCLCPVLDMPPLPAHPANTCISIACRACLVKTVAQVHILSESRLHLDSRGGEQVDHDNGHDGD